MLFFFLVSQAFAKIWYKNFDMVKGENYTFSVPQPWVADLYLLFHSYANTNIKITYLTRKEYRPAFTLYYGPENMTAPFLRFRYLFPKIEITALADTKIVFGIFEEDDCSTIVGCNDDFEETLSGLETSKKCVFGVYEQRTEVRFEIACVKDWCTAFTYTNSDGEWASETEGDTKRHFDGLGFLFTFTGTSSTNQYDLVELSASRVGDAPTKSHTSYVTTYLNDPYPNKNKTIDITTTSTDENSASGTTGINNFFESSNLIIIAIVGGIIVCAAIILFSVLLKKRRDSKEKESSS